MDRSQPADPGREWSGSRPGDDTVERRLAALESRLDDLDEAIREVLPAALGKAAEEACREAVEAEMQAVTEDLRRSVSELGRLLLRDLDRLTKLLADHRDDIVERLLAAVEEPPPPADPPAAGPAEPGGPAEDEDEVEAEATVPAASAALAGEEGRWRVLPGRRRPKASGRGARGGAGRPAGA